MAKERKPAVAAQKKKTKKLTLTRERVKNKIRFDSVSRQTIVLAHHITIWLLGRLYEYLRNSIFTIFEASTSPHRIDFCFFFLFKLIAERSYVFVLWFFIFQFWHPNPIKQYENNRSSIETKASRWQPAMYSSNTAGAAAKLKTRIKHRTRNWNWAIRHWSWRAKNCAKIEVHAIKVWTNCAIG